MHSFYPTGSSRIQFKADQRAWEGQFDGRHWIARILQVDEDVGICGLHVATGSARDELATQPNCRWDYERDHFVDRFSSPDVPPALTTEMLGALREWLANFRARREQAQAQYQYAALDGGLLR